MNVAAGIALTPKLPTYAATSRLLPILVGVQASLLTSMRMAIYQEKGTRQQQADWTHPDVWIDERLSGEHARLARRIWSESEQVINPRYLQGLTSFLNRHRLLAINPDGRFVADDRTQLFLEQQPALLRSIDEYELIPELVDILAVKSRSKRSELMPEWSEILRSRTTCQSDSAISRALYYRLKNLEARDMVRQEGAIYSITAAGVEYAVGSQSVAHRPTESSSNADAPSSVAPARVQIVDERRREVTRAINEYNDAQMRQLYEYMAVMPPYQFEHLIRDLLEAMGYDDVTVTRESGDRGVDVVATVQFGITTIKEVVQVKRMQGTISRPVIDQLRGALPYFGAIRGTLITIGRFSSGCAEAALYPGAAPISLIDGKRLLELLVEHEVGIRRRPATLYEVDTALFSQTANSDLEDDELATS